MFRQETAELLSSEKSIGEGKLDRIRRWIARWQRRFDFVEQMKRFEADPKIDPRGPNATPAGVSHHEQPGFKPERNRALKLGRKIPKKCGSPTWIRTTIHGSKGRCPTVRRSGKLGAVGPAGTDNTSLPHAATIAPSGPFGSAHAETNPGRCRARTSNPACVTSYRGWVRPPLVSATCSPLARRRKTRKPFFIQSFEPNRLRRVPPSANVNQVERKQDRNGFGKVRETQLLRGAWRRPRGQRGANS